MNQKSPRNRKDTRKIRIVFLIGQLGFGGSERQLFLLLKHIDKELFDCHIIVFNSSPNITFDDALKVLGVEVIPVPISCKGITARMLFIYRELKRIAPDIVHSWTFHDNAYAGLIGWLAAVPVRLGSNRNSFDSVGIRSLPFLYRFLSLHSVSGIVVNSNALSEELIGRNYSKNKTFVVPNCVEALVSDDLTNSSVPDLSSLGIHDHHRIVGIVGNFRRQKNHVMFVDGMSRLSRQFPDVRGLIVGHRIPSEPELKDAIEAKINSLGLQNKIVLTGFRNDVPKLMRRFTVFCLTSNYEGLPNVLLEAMAASCPVVATRVQGVAEIVRDGVNGLLVEPGDVEGFGRSVETILKDPHLGNRLGKAGREIVERLFGCGQLALRLTNLYLEALSRKGCHVGTSAKKQSSGCRNERP